MKTKLIAAVSLVSVSILLATTVFSPTKKLSKDEQLAIIVNTFLADMADADRDLQESIYNPNNLSSDKRLELSQRAKRKTIAASEKNQYAMENLK